jgi:hypothetical protein
LCNIFYKFLKNQSCQNRTNIFIYVFLHVSLKKWLKLFEKKLYLPKIFFVKLQICKQTV